ncbi:hypothetical protein OPT61_g8257 [Boeremia exigua]|uniref:Uncharacterized protein n=1 Tax=Boeremia exigua TaxID=749465 RepID=A0ACC2I038_9PLEO|nr:hypothetical protein OPT61_g8257 [Boeremia exigua]
MANTQSVPDRHERQRRARAVRRQLSSIAPNNSMPQEQSLFFLKLPAEIRFLIFQLLLSQMHDHSRPISMHSISPLYRPGHTYRTTSYTAILRTCRIVYYEAHSIPIRSATHHFRHLGSTSWLYEGDVWLHHMTKQCGAEVYHLHDNLVALNLRNLTKFFLPHLNWKRITWTICAYLWPPVLAGYREIDRLAETLAAIELPASCQEVNLEFEIREDVPEFRKSLQQQAELCKKIGVVTVTDGHAEGQLDNAESAWNQESAGLRKNDGSRLRFDTKYSKQYTWIGSGHARWGTSAHIGEKETVKYRTTRLCWRARRPRRDYMSYDHLDCLDFTKCDEVKNRTVAAKELTATLTCALLQGPASGPPRDTLVDPAHLLIRNACRAGRSDSAATPRLLIDLPLPLGRGGPPSVKNENKNENASTPVYRINIKTEGTFAQKKQIPRSTEQYHIPQPLDSSVGHPPSTHYFLSKEEQAFLASRQYTRAIERIRQEEEVRRLAKEESKQRKKAAKAKAKAKVQAKKSTLTLKKAGASGCASSGCAGGACASSGAGAGAAVPVVSSNLLTPEQKEEAKKKRETQKKARKERKAHRKAKRAEFREKIRQLANRAKFGIAHALSFDRDRTVKETARSTGGFQWLPQASPLLRQHRKEYIPFTRPLLVTTVSTLPPRFMSILANPDASPRAPPKRHQYNLHQTPYPGIRVVPAGLPRTTRSSISMVYYQAGTAATENIPLRRHREDHCSNVVQGDVKVSGTGGGGEHGRHNCSSHHDPQLRRRHTMLASSTRSAFVAASKRPYICRSCLRRAKQLPLAAGSLPPRSSVRSLQTTSQPLAQDDTPFRKALKDAAKQHKKASKGGKKSQKASDPRLEKWELTVGIEIHAELNTARKLFSSAATSMSEPPNTHASLFDIAFPGSQPHFQKETLLPALRAALALDCTIQPRSSFDRKHYFYQDQPNGYQITQYYEPFAKDGHITLFAHDFPAGSAPENCPITIGIKQVQMEQDTAKTVQQPPSTHLLDFNRVSHPLIEIITLPHIHDPLVAAACVRKIQTILKTVDACTAGMEMGGLRADVNVSIRDRSQTSSEGGLSYSGVTGLGQRTEIKNLASVKAVEDAIVAERDRQIELVESGGAVEGETRGWTVGSKTTKRLRGKEGEIDYRYMPDPDISPVYIAQDLVDHLRTNLPVLPDRIVDVLVEKYGLSTKDAGTLLSFDNGDRLEYFFEVTNQLARARDVRPSDTEFSIIGKAAGNWVLMELGTLYKDEEWSETRVSPKVLVSVINPLLQKRITSRSARKLLAAKFEGEERDVEQLIEDFNMVLRPLSAQEYSGLAWTLLEEKPDMVRDIVEKGHEKKIKWFVGQMMARSPEGTVEADVAEQAVKQLLPQQRAE